MGYPQYSTKSKTDTTAFIWASHLASLLIDASYSASKLRTQIKLTTTIKTSDFIGFYNNFDELYESTKHYLKIEDIERLGLEVMFSLEDKKSVMDSTYVKTLLGSFFAYNSLIHQSKLMRLIEEASIWKDDGT
jgi:hypothetical protein